MKNTLLIAFLTICLSAFSRNDSTHVVNVRLVPGVYGNIFKENGKRSFLAGANVEVGAVFKERFYLNAGTGYQYSETGGVLPAYVAFHTTIINDHVTPYLSTGIGYAGIFRGKTRFDGLNTFFGTGVNINVNKDLSLAFYPSYRFIYAPKYGYVNKESTFIPNKYFHQLAVNVSIRFY